MFGALLGLALPALPSLAVIRLCLIAGSVVLALGVTAAVTVKNRWAAQSSARAAYRAVDAAIARTQRIATRAASDVADRTAAIDALRAEINTLQEELRNATPMSEACNACRLPDDRRRLLRRAITGTAATGAGAGRESGASAAASR